MPFKSKAQEKWMFSKYPQMAKQWAAITNQKALPEKVKSKKKKKNGK
jgi:hypothetical protein